MSPTTTPELERLLDEAAAAWPTFRVERARFRAFLEAAPGEVELTELRLVDLYLVCACLDGDAEAVARMHAEYLAELPAVLVGARLPASVADEALGVLRELLFFAPAGRAEARPRLLDYRGHGDLRSWLRVVAMRTALDLMRRTRKDVPLAPALVDALPVEADDPELAHLKHLYRDEFRLAFEEALRVLSSRERNLLRHHLVADLSIDQVGAIYRVHRATAARWLDAARAHLVAEIHARLMTRLRTDRGDVDSILRLIRSQIDVSVRGYLTDREE